MDDIFHILSSSTRTNKNKRRKASAHRPAPGKPLPPPPTAPAVGSGAAALRHHREEISAFLRRMNIQVVRPDSSSLSPPDPTPSFPAALAASPAPLRAALLHNIEQGSWTEPTPVQMQALPALLAGWDCVCTAPTGSGKTGAFALACLAAAPVVDAAPREKTACRPRSVILAPSRELVLQISREVRRLAAGKPGGVCVADLCSSAKSTAGALRRGEAIGGKKGLDVLVSTPAALLTVVDCIDWSGCGMFVMDEADRLLEDKDGKRTPAGGAVGDGEEEGEKKGDSGDEDNGDENSDGSSVDGSGDASDTNNDDDDVDSGSPSHGKKKGRGFAQSKKQSIGPKHGGTGRTSFLSQVDAILAYIPQHAIRAFFSATITGRVRDLAHSVLRSPLEISVAAGRSGAGQAAGGASPDVTQELLFVGKEEGKLLAVRQMMVDGGSRPPVLIFVRSKDRAEALWREVRGTPDAPPSLGPVVDVLHADRSPAERDAAVERFRSGATWYLICTDVIGRGADFRAVNVVVNYDLPPDGVTYVHRIGRTGRAGRPGRAVTFFTESDMGQVRTIANIMKVSGCEVPAWMMALRKEGKRGRMALSLDKSGIDTKPKYDRLQEKKKRALESENKKKLAHRKKKRKKGEKQSEK